MKPPVDSWQTRAITIIAPRRVARSIIGIIVNSKSLIPDKFKSSHFFFFFRCLFYICNVIRFVNVESPFLYLKALFMRVERQLIIFYSLCY